MPTFVKPEVKVDNTLAAQAFAAIGSVSRIQVLWVILEARERGLTIGEIQKKTGIAASTFAHHHKSSKSKITFFLGSIAKKRRFLIFSSTFLIILSSFIFALCTWAIEAAATGSDRSIISLKLD